MYSSVISIAALAASALAAPQQQPDLSSTAKLFPPGPDAKSPLLFIRTPPGPYKVDIRTDPQFPRRTIYVPQNANESLPIVAWENGICYKYGRMYAGFLSEIASHGYLVVAPGSPDKKDSGLTTASWQMESIEQARSWKPSGLSIRQDRVAVGGHSCGGIETVRNLANDEEGVITTGLILNSGGRNSQFDDIKAPLLVIHGGAKDIPGANDNNFKYVQEERPDLPVFKAVLETGHLGSYWSPRGGIYAETVVRWLDWTLKGKPAAGDFFKGGAQSDAAKRGWKVESNGIDKAGRKRRAPKAVSGVVGLQM